MRNYPENGKRGIQVCFNRFLVIFLVQSSSEQFELVDLILCSIVCRGSCSAGARSVAVTTAGTMIRRGGKDARYTKGNC